MGIHYLNLNKCTILFIALNHIGDNQSNSDTFLYYLPF